MFRVSIPASAMILAATVTLLTAAAPTLAGQDEFVKVKGTDVSEDIVPIGFYQTAPGKAGERNRLNVQLVNGDSYEITISTVYCAYSYSRDCANARFGKLSIVVKLQEGRMAYRDDKTTCALNIEFSPNKAKVEQAGECPSIPYSNASGIYVKTNATPQEIQP